jgi:hypothetical protein
MGDRANVCVKGWGNEGDVFLYTHWTGTELPQIVQTALARRERWDDNSYLTRIIFCEMVKGDEDGSTGYGISATVGDGDDRVLVVDPNTETLWREGREDSPISFEQYVTFAGKLTWEMF